MDVFKLILSIVGSLLLTELFMEKVILKFYKFNGIFIGHVLIFYVVFLLTFTAMKFILRIDGKSEDFDLEKWKKNWTIFIKINMKNKKRP